MGISVCLAMAVRTLVAFQVVFLWERQIISDGGSSNLGFQTYSRGALPKTVDIPSNLMPGW